MGDLICHLSIYYEMDKGTVEEIVKDGVQFNLDVKEGKKRVLTFAN